MIPWSGKKASDLQQHTNLIHFSIVDNQDTESNVSSWSLRLAEDFFKMLQQVFCPQVTKATNLIANVSFIQYNGGYLKPFILIHDHKG